MVSSFAVWAPADVIITELHALACVTAWETYTCNTPDNFPDFWELFLDADTEKELQELFKEHDISVWQPFEYHTLEEVAAYITDEVNSEYYQALRLLDKYAADYKQQPKKG